MGLHNFNPILGILVCCLLALPQFVICSSYPEVFDVVTMALKPTCVNRQMVTSVNKFMVPKPRNVHIVAARGCKVFSSFADNVVCHPEDKLVPGLTIAGVSGWLETRFLARSEKDADRIKRRSTWFYQQFLKLAVAAHIPGLSDYFLVYDSDMIALRPMTWFIPLDHSHASGPGSETTALFPPVRPVPGKAEQPCANRHPFRMLVHVGGWRPKYGYMRTYEILTGQKILYAHDNSSLVTHNILVYRPYMAQFLANITTAKHRDTQHGWAHSVADAVVQLRDMGEVIVGFSEFWSYLSWVQDRYPCAYMQAEQRVWTRTPAQFPRSLPIAVSVDKKQSYIHVCCPTADNIAATRDRGFYFTGYELGHLKYCNYHHDAFHNGYAEWYQPT